MLRFEWGGYPGSRWEHIFPIPPTWPSWAVQRLLDGRGKPPGFDPLSPSIVAARSVAGFWSASTLGLVDFDFEIFPFDDADTPTLAHASHADGRGVVVDAARKQAAQDVPLNEFGHLVVWVHPPPSDGGATGADALFDQNGWHGFYCHEIGHTLGLIHPYGPGGVYDDPYCVMGSGGGGPLAADPLFEDLPLPDGFWNTACMASAATLFWRWENELSVRNMIHPADWGSPFEVELTALSEAEEGDLILATVDVGNDFDRNPRRTWPQSGTYLTEYRTATGWDRNIQPAIVIHSRDIRPKPIVRTTDVHHHPFRYGEVRPVYFEGTVPAPFSSVYVSPNERFALEVLDISADRKVAKVRIGLPSQLRYQADLQEVARELIGEQVLETGTKTITPEEDPLLCQPGTYAYTRFDQAEEITVRLHLAGFTGITPAWRISWWADDNQPLASGDTTLHARPGWTGHRHDEYLDLSLRGDVLVIRTRLAQPDTEGRLWPKRANELDITVVAEEMQPSGFVVRREAALTIFFRTERTDLDQRYKDDVDLCYFLRTLSGVDKLPQQPPWRDPSDPLWREKLREELVEIGRLPGGAW